ncbi:MAG: FAD-binding oxidoreductase [Steroidobacteraceae bacterium]
MKPADFAEALRQFEAVVGKDWVFTSDEDLHLYRDAYSILWGEPEERIASAAVAPDSLEQVQQIVRIANKYKVPIYPISTGRNLGYGGAAPSYSGSVVLDLKRMNRILEVNERHAYVLVEPGVSYFDLYRYIQERGLRLVVDVPDPGWGSLVGNSLDHGAGYLQPAFRNHFDSHCGMEVVLADGEVLRTGMGAVPNAKTWQQYKFGTGPWIDGIFSQSNFGVVTKMGFWLMPQPDAYFSGTVFVPRREDLSPMIDLMSYLENVGVVNGLPDLGGPVYGGYLSPRDPRVVEFMKLPSTQTEEDIVAFTRANNIPYWSVTLKFYGAEKALRENWEYCKAKFSAEIPGSTFKDGEMIKFPLTAEQKEQVHKPEFGIPSLELFTRGLRSPVNPEPDFGHVFLSMIIPRTGEAIVEFNKVMGDLSKELGLVDSRLIGEKFTYRMPMAYWNRSFMLGYGFSVTHDPEKNKKIRDGILKMMEVAAQHGWAEYRTPPAFQDALMNTYSFNNHILRRFNETLKDAVDPNGILSAGRYGIWPKHLRKKQ